jgi:DNA-binding NarL/FixJ family response regulator
VVEEIKEYGLRVLLVDDNESFLESLTRLISSFPSVTIIGKTISGESALGMCERLKPDLIIMDIKMPGISGFEAARLMKNLNYPPRILLISFNNEPEYLFESLSAGADGYMTKSEISTGLFRRISSIFSINSGAAS